MNSETIHSRAEQLIAQEFVEGIPASDRSWLEQHLRECEPCAAFASATDRALRALNSVAIQIPPGLAQKTQFRVRLRAQQQPLAAPVREFLWVACGASWAFGAITAPVVWRVLHWAGDRLAMPHLVTEIGFGLWWALPAIVAGAIVFAENARNQRERDWVGQQDWEQR